MIPQPSSNGHAEKPSPAWEFREQFIPPRLFFLLRDQKITASDLLILLVVNAMVRPQGTGKEACGCFAKNEYIAKATGLHPMYTSSRISYLKESNLLITVKLKGRRYLETSWSRTADELKELEGKYGKLLRREHRRIIKEENAGKGFPLSEGKGKPLGEVKENLYHKNNDKIKDKERKNISPPANGVRSEADRLWGFCQCVGDKVASMLKRKGIINFIQISAWGKQVKSLVTEDGFAEDFVESTLDWYIRHHGEEFVPEIYNSAQVRSKFSQIAGAKKRGSRIDGDQLKPPHAGVC